MTDQGIVHRGTRALIIVATVVVILWGINQAQSVLVLFIVSCFLAVIGTAPVLWLERKGISSLLAVLLVMTAMVTLLLSIGFVVGVSLNNFSNALPLYQTRMHEMLMGFKGVLAAKGVTMTDKVLLGYVNPEAVMNFTASFFTALSSALSNTLLILFTVMFILLEAAGFPAKLRSVLHDSSAAFPQFTGFVHDIKRYIIIKTLINLIVGILTATWLSILGVDFPVLWGFLAFLLHYVPSVGSVLSAIPAVLLALIQLGGGSAALTAAGYLAIGMIIGNVIEPKIMGQRLGLSTLIVFVSLIVWGYLLGVVGALLCVPLTMAVKLACEESDQTRWIAVLLGPNLSSKEIRAASKRK